MRMGLGVIMDWVPAHFTRDAHGLRLFDGTPLFEHPDPRRSEMPQWGTLLFNFEQTQVQSFLLSSAMYWLREFHFDGLRVDAVSCMLYLDFGKQDGGWLPNRYGGHDNLDAVSRSSASSTPLWANSPAARCSLPRRARLILTLRVPLPKTGWGLPINGTWGG